MRTTARHARGIVPPVNGRTFAAVVLVLGIIAGALLGLTRPAQAATTARVPVAYCTFDGGGSIDAGQLARTDTGIWACNADGTLTRVATWAHIMHACHVHAVPCYAVPPAIRSALGIRAGQRAVMAAWPTITYVYVQTSIGAATVAGAS